MSLPEIQEAWTAHAGDLVLLRLRERRSPEALEMDRKTLDRVTEKTGVEFLILDPAVEVVNPTSGESA